MSNYAESVEDQIATEAASQFWSAFCELTGRDFIHVTHADYVLEQLARRTVEASLARAREMLAVPRVGAMTFDEAMQAAIARTEVTRAGWDIFRHLWSAPDTEEVWERRGDSEIGPYRPTDDDRTATDWMPYQDPEINLYIDFDDLLDKE